MIGITPYGLTHVRSRFRHAFLEVAARGLACGVVGGMAAPTSRPMRPVKIDTDSAERGASLELPGGRPRQLRGRPPGGQAADLRRSRDGGIRACLAGVPPPGGHLPGRRGGDTAVPRRRHGHAHGRQHARGRPGGRPGLPDRLRRQRPRRPLARARPAALGRRAASASSTPTPGTPPSVIAGAAGRSTSPSRSGSS